LPLVLAAMAAKVLEMSVFMLCFLWSNESMNECGMCCWYASEQT